MAEKKNAEYEQSLELAQTVARASEPVLFAERKQRHAAEAAWFAEKHVRHGAEAAWLAEKQQRHAAQAALSAENERRRLMQAEAASTKMELVALEIWVIALAKDTATILDGMGMTPPPPDKLDFSANPLENQVLLQRMAIGSLERNVTAAREWAERESMAKRNYRRQVRCGNYYTIVIPQVQTNNNK